MRSGPRKSKRVTDLRFALPIGYALLLAPAGGPPFLATAFASRSELLSALNAQDTPEGWRRITGSYRLALEIQTPRDVNHAIETMKRFFPQHVAATERLLYGWLRKSSIARPRSKRRIPCASMLLDNAETVC